MRLIRGPTLKLLIMTRALEPQASVGDDDRVLARAALVVSAATSHAGVDVGIRRSSPRIRATRSPDIGHSPDATVSLAA
jgi:hypothetical protein